MGNNSFDEYGKNDGGGNDNDYGPSGRGPKRKKHKVIRIIGMTIGGVILACLFALLFGLAVKWLWNALMPEIFGLPVITYWQAFGLVVLAKLLFGSFGHGSCDDNKYHKHENDFCSPHNKHREARKKWHKLMGFDGCDIDDNDDPESWVPKGSNKNWKFYPRYWKEEGKEHFEAYIDKVSKNNDDEKKDGE